MRMAASQSFSVEADLCADPVAKISEAAPGFAAAFIDAVLELGRVSIVDEQLSLKAEMAPVRWGIGTDTSVYEGPGLEDSDRNRNRNRAMLYQSPRGDRHRRSGKESIGQ